MDSRATNGDGFGVGWYHDNNTVPALYKSVEPAWHDRNMRDLSQHISSATIFAHVRSATAGLSVQQTNCHPFRYQNWLWMHNGTLREFVKIKRTLMFAIDPELYPFVEGSTDTECFFYLALTFGLQRDPVKAVSNAVAFIEHVGHMHGVEFPVQMTVATTDGSGTIWAFRYSSERASRSLFYSTDASILAQLYPDGYTTGDGVNSVTFNWADLGKDARFIVSEPLGDMEGAWNAVPESTCVQICGNTVALSPFVPIMPTDAPSIAMSRNNSPHSINGKKSPAVAAVAPKAPEAVPELVIAINNKLRVDAQDELLTDGSRFNEQNHSASPLVKA